LNIGDGDSNDLANGGSNTDTGQSDPGMPGYAAKERAAGNNRMTRRVNIGE
jgi:hypothetical protein